MEKEYKITNSFVSKDRETKEPQIITTQYGDLYKHMLQLEGEGPEWITHLKKTDTPLEKGSVLYGKITTNKWGKKGFQAVQRPTIPEAEIVPQKGGSDIEAKLDYAISLLENFLEYLDGKKQETTVAGTQNDGALNLDDLEF